LVYGAGCGVKGLKKLPIYYVLGIARDTNTMELDELE